MYLSCNKRECGLICRSIRRSVAETDKMKIIAIFAVAVGTVILRFQTFYEPATLRHRLGAVVHGGSNQYVVSNRMGGNHNWKK